MQTERTLEQRNEAQRKTIVEQGELLKVAGARIKELEMWERFTAYLLNNCEGEEIYEEKLQEWLADMLAAEKL
jgi:hypothetical protein